MPCSENFGTQVKRCLSVLEISTEPETKMMEPETARGHEYFWSICWDAFWSIRHF